jgi:hypothetical protein
MTTKVINLPFQGGLMAVAAPSCFVVVTGDRTRTPMNRYYTRMGGNDTRTVFFNLAGKEASLVDKHFQCTHILRIVAAGRLKLTISRVTRTLVRPTLVIDQSVN